MSRDPHRSERAAMARCRPRYRAVRFATRELFERAGSEAMRCALGGGDRRDVRRATRTLTRGACVCSDGIAPWPEVVWTYESARLAQLAPHTDREMPHRNRTSVGS